MSLADQFAGAISCAQFHQLNNLSHDLWRAYDAGHLGEGEVQALAEAIEARKPKRPVVEPTSCKPVHLPKPKPQRSPDRQASIERRRRLARRSPLPGEFIDKFRWSEHAVMTVVANEIARSGACTWCIDKIAALSGVCRTTVRNALRRARELGLLYSEERRRCGQKSLTNVVRVLLRSWGSWLRRIGCKKFATTTDKVSRIGDGRAVDRSGEGFRANVALL